MLFLYASIMHSLMGEEQFSNFPKILNWEIGETEHYTPNTLYNAINGGSELYLKYDFLGMTTTDYVHNDNYITVELYKHATPNDAFGVYSMERPREDKYVNIGVQGFSEPDYIYFIAGQYYIKIRCLKVTPNSSSAMMNIASELSKQLNRGTVYPSLFHLFPNEKRIEYSDRYIKESVLGYSFLKNSFETDYKTDDNEYTLFILEGFNSEEAEAMLQAYLKNTNTIEPADKNSYIPINDRYNGDIALWQTDRYLIGSRGAISESESKKILREIAEQITKL